MQASEAEGAGVYPGRHPLFEPRRARVRCAVGQVRPQSRGRGHTCVSKQVRFVFVIRVIITHSISV